MNPALISRNAKERFLLKMSEDEFRDRVVRPILLLRGLKDGRDLCGPTELGKDAIFYDHDKLGNFELTAIQTKKGSANLAAKAKSNIVDLVAQLRTAAATSYALLQPIRTKRKPSRVLLVVSGKINEHARKHIVEEVTDTNLGFLDVDDLIPWIDTLLPQLWLDMDANVSTYLAALEKQLLGGEGPFARQFLPADAHLPKSCFSDDAVTVYARRSKAVERPAPSKGSKKPKDDALFPLHALVSKPYKKILLLGEGGGGKTVGLLQIVYRAAKAGLENGVPGFIPVLVKATDLAAATPSDLTSYLEETSRTLSVQKKPVFGLSDLNSGMVYVFIDGLDEVANQSERIKIAELAEDFSARFSKCAITISSRPYEYLADIKALENYERFNIAPIDWKSAERIVELTRQGREISSGKTKEALSHLSRIQGFSLNPLMISVYAATANFDLQDVPPNITELFKRFTEHMLGRWDEQRGLKNLHRPLVKDFALCALAFQMHTQRVTKISRIEAEFIIETQLIETGYKADANGILDEILDRSGLFRNFGSEIGFRHHMFQEFFAGRGIPSGGVATAQMSDQWWRRPIVFYFGDNPKTAGDLSNLVKQSSAVASDKQFTIAVTGGLALQACYLSAVKAKIEIWKNILENFADLRDAFVAEHNPHGFLPIITDASFTLLLRDAISLSNIVEARDEIGIWIESQSKNKDYLGALYVFALMRIGRFDLVSPELLAEVCERQSQAVVVLLELVEASQFRPLSPAQKEFAAKLEAPLEKKLQDLAKAVIHEARTQVEMQKLAQTELAARTQAPSAL